MKGLSVSIVIDSNHDQDKITGISITYIIVFVGRNSNILGIKKTSSEQTSTFSVEFISMKKAVEEAATSRYYFKLI